MPAPLQTGILAAAGVAFASAAILTDAALRPQSTLFGRTLIAGADPAEVALTYDDGPNTAATPQLLDLLAAHNVRATFFMIGRFVRRQPELARRVHAAGHLVANHTMTHPWLSWSSRAAIDRELRDTNALLEDTIGAPVLYFRPPHGARRPYVLRAARALDLTVVQWNIIAKDWQPIGPEGILRNIRTGLAQTERHHRSANLVLHDGWDQAMPADRTATVAATSTLLETLPAQGKRFVTVDAWVGIQS